MASEYVYCPSCGNHLHRMDLPCACRCGAHLRIIPEQIEVYAFAPPSSVISKDPDPYEYETFVVPTPQWMRGQVTGTRIGFRLKEER